MCSQELVSDDVMSDYETITARQGSSQMGAIGDTLPLTEALIKSPQKVRMCEWNEEKQKSVIGDPGAIPFQKEVPRGPRSLPSWGIQER